MTFCVFADFRHYEVNSDAENIDKIHDVYLNDESWKVRWLVVKAGHWFSSNKVQLDPRKIVDAFPEAHSINVSVSKDSIEKAPSAKQDPLSAIRMIRNTATQ